MTETFAHGLYTDVDVWVTNRQDSANPIQSFVLVDGDPVPGTTSMIDGGVTETIVHQSFPADDGGVGKVYVELWDMSFPALVEVGLGWQDDDAARQAMVYNRDPNLGQDEEWYLDLRRGSVTIDTDDRQGKAHGPHPPSVP